MAYRSPIPFPSHPVRAKGRALVRRVEMLKASAGWDGDAVDHATTYAATVRADMRSRALRSVFVIPPPVSGGHPAQSSPAVQLWLVQYADVRATKAPVASVQLCSAVRVLRDGSSALCFAPTHSVQPAGRDVRVRLPRLPRAGVVRRGAARIRQVPRRRRCGGCATAVSPRPKRGSCLCDEPWACKERSRSMCCVTLAWQTIAAWRCRGTERDS